MGVLDKSLSLHAERLVLAQVASASVGESEGAQLLTSAIPGLTLYNATLFIDTPDIANYTTAAASASGQKFGMEWVPGWGCVGSYGYGSDAACYAYQPGRSYGK